LSVASDPYNSNTDSTRAAAMDASAEPPVYPVAFDDRAIIKALGSSPEAIRRNLRLYNQTDLQQPTDMTIYQWVSRGKIADRWRPRLLYCALRSGKLSMAQALKFDIAVAADA
jgi:hypothetical protein